MTDDEWEKLKPLAEAKVNAAMAISSRASKLGGFPEHSAEYRQRCLDMERLTIEHNAASALLQDGVRAAGLIPKL